jgi:pimeloyl-ACP methyl ester carboxylesterase
MQCEKREENMPVKPLCLFLVALAVLILASCVSTSYVVRPAEVPQDLDSWLAAKEASVAGVIPASRKEIVWAGESGAKTPYSIIYIHGWEGSSRDYAAVLQRVASELDANVYYSRLKGYGVTTEQIVDVTLDDWINDTWEALEIGRRLGDRVIVAGSSMGGDLALWLATRHQPDIAALVLFSCAVQPKDGASELLLWPWPFPQILLGAVIGRYTALSFDATKYPTGSAELYARLYPTRYRSESFLKLMAAVKLTRTLPLADITTPSIWLYSDKDDAVNIPVLKKFFARTGGAPKRLVRVDGAHSHMLAGDVFSPETNAEVSGDIISFLLEAGL